MFEIRNYHYDPSQFDAYKKWIVEEALPFLKANMDVVGFWMGNVEPPQVSGSKPMDLPHGSANVTWIIRWDSKEQRDELFWKAIESDEWQAVWAKHPDPNGYRQMLARFMAEM